MLPKPRKRPITEEKRFSLNVAFWKICVHRSSCVNEQQPRRGPQAQKIALLAGLIGEVPEPRYRKPAPTSPTHGYPRPEKGIRTLTVAEWIAERQEQKLNQG